MSKVYKQINSIAGANGAVFGGGGGGGGRKKKKTKKTTNSAFSGPALESERRRTGNSTGPMNAQMKEDLRVNPPDHSKTIANTTGVVSLAAIRVPGPAGAVISGTAGAVSLVASNWPD